MKKTLSFAGTVLAVSLLGNTMAFAQPTPPAKMQMHPAHNSMMRVEPIVHQLNLNPHQVKIYQQTRGHLMQERRQLKKQLKLAKRNMQNVFNAEMGSDDPNIEHIMTAHKMFKSAFDHYHLVSQREHVKFFNSLNPQQKKLLLQRMSQQSFAKRKKFARKATMRLRDQAPPPAPLHL